MAPCRLLLPLAALAALALPAPAMAATCAGADVEAATVCLLNEQRAAQGLAPLATRPDLTAAARVHAQDMVARGYFAHDAPDGTTLLDRLKAASWVPASGFWIAGENIAWGSGRLATPSEIVNAWMASPGHRANILRREFDEVGLAVAAGAPGTGASGASTYVADFGAREQDPAAGGEPLAGPQPAATTPARSARRCTRAARRTRGTSARRAALRRCAVAARRARR